MSKDSGRVTSDMTVVRTLARNRKSTITTKMAPSMSDSCTLSIELFMKLACLNISVDTCTSDGMFFLRSFMASSSFSVSSIVPVLGCFVTVSSTAGLPFSEATPSLGCCAPIFTSATSASVTVVPEAVLRADCDNFSTSFSETIPRTMYSLPY